MQKKKYIFVCFVLLSFLFITAISTYSSGYLGGIIQHEDGTTEFFDGSFDEFVERMNENVEKALGGGWADTSGSPLTSTEDTSGSASNSSTNESKPVVKSCDHHYVSKITQEPTCAEAGLMTFTCDKCGDTYTQEIPATGKHDYIEEITLEASCDHTGIKTYTCSVCGDTYTEIIPMIEHDYKKTVTKQATCTEDGELTFTCTRCGDTYTEPIPALGHLKDSGTVIKESTLFFDGVKEYYCERDGELLETEVLPSMFPTYYLYILIGVGVVILILIVVIVVKFRKNKF